MQNDDFSGTAFEDEKIEESILYGSTVLKQKIVLVVYNLLPRVGIY